MRRIEHYWQSHNGISTALLPLSLLFGAVSAIRRSLYRVGILQVHRFAVPVLVVGNITVGGTGKSPLVIWLAHHLRDQGWRPGIVSRGYSGGARHWPQQVRPDSDPQIVGDEAVMLAAAALCPVCAGPDRVAAVAALLDHTDVNIVISDDGLQHYALGRDLEIALVDGQRLFGNGRLLPAGPLREPLARLGQVDLVLVNGEVGEVGYPMAMRYTRLRALHSGGESDLERFAGTAVHAVAGIGNPQRFFDLLSEHGIEVTPHPFPDHHRFSADDLELAPRLPLLMTAKDAVKCARLACDDCWVVEVDVLPDQAFVAALNRVLKDIVDGQKTVGHTGLPDLQGKAGLPGEAGRTDLQD